ncbi:MAG: hypothetical protein DRI77_15420 [Chloroflexi bacterium]|nr:MAG: hypothetical protein DRI77_15420 [Chloroflexota bacterium]
MNRKFASIFVLALLVLSCSPCGLFGHVPEATAVPTPTTPPAANVTPTPADIEPTTTAEATAPSGDLQVVAVNGYQGRNEDWRVVGLVTNGTDRAVDSVEIEVEILDASGTSLYSEVANTSLYNLAPGETSPFSWWVTEDLPDADSVTAMVVGQSTTTLERAQVEIRGTVMIVDDDGDLYVTGEIVNDGDQPVEINGLAAATFDGDGEIVTANDAGVLLRYLKPGASGPFRVTMDGPASGVEEIVEYDIYLDAEITSPEDEMALLLSEHHDYVDSRFEDLHLVGEVMNDDDESWNVTLLAAIYDADDNVIDASSLSLPVSALAPGETIPYDFDSWGPLNYKAGFIEQAVRYTVQWDPYWTWTTDTVYEELSTVNDERLPVSANGLGTFTGQVVNDSGETLDYAIIILGLRDSTGQIVGTDSMTVWDDLAVCASAEYAIYVDFDPDLDVDSLSYFTLVRGKRR